VASPAERRRRAAEPERGAILLELALASVVLIALLGAAFDYGRVLYTAQHTQRVAGLLARELALLPLPATGLSLAEALACRRARVLDPDSPCRRLAGFPVLPREVVFDPDWLAFDVCAEMAPLGLDCTEPGDREAFLDPFFGALPVGNQMLRPLLIWDRTPACPTVEPCILRYPGALVADPASASGFSVVVPILAGDEVRCIPVVEAVLDGATGQDRFPVERGGVVGLRVNYPFQAAALLARNAAGEPLVAVERDCPALAPGQATVETLGSLPALDADPGVGPNAGPLGLGRQLALGRELRPFRRVVSAEAVFRREVLQ